LDSDCPTRTFEDYLNVAKNWDAQKVNYLSIRKQFIFGSS
jgi:hypothetical protein